ncbi:MAG: hypothetical protein P8179_20000 [Candidatus Thiodiazotropha sp.]
MKQNNLNKNNSVWRPDQEDFDSATFKVIVGDRKFTKGGQPKGTIFDSTDNGYLEIKGGTSQLNPSFQDWLDRWGVNVVKPE